jgi:glucosamine-6-phosphate deaminase
MRNRSNREAREKRMPGQPRITVVPDYAAMSRRAAEIVAETVMQAPGAAIAVPTGSTPLGMFDELVSMVKNNRIDLAQTHIFCLDEYIGVTREDPNSLTGWLWKAFLGPAGIPNRHVHAIDTTDPDPEAAAARYEQALIALGGLELAVLGLGPNGHIAYNEPGSLADSRSRVVDLTPQSIAQASAYWENTVPIPRRAMTIGVGTLLDARRIALIVSGADKAGMLHRALDKPMSAEVPASWLRLAGERLEVIADEPAMSKSAVV